jgi:hypothetical protein
MQLWLISLLCSGQIAGQFLLVVSPSEKDVTP